MHFYNLHTHRKARSAEEYAIRNAYAPARLPQVSYPLSVGLHPWFVGADWLEGVQKVAGLAGFQQVKAIGEVGLDRHIDTSIHLQMQALEAQIAIANDVRKPLIFHAVRTYADFPFFLRQLQVTAAFHDFRGNSTQVAQLSPYPVFFSFGKSLFQPNAQDKIRHIPPNRILLETDSSAYNIADVYQQAAKLLGLDLEDLAGQIAMNFTRFMGAALSELRNGG